MTVKFKGKKPILQACPFCGSSDVELENVYGLAFHVECHNVKCACTGPSFLQGKKHNGMWAKEAAINAWNTRKSPDDVKVLSYETGRVQ